MNAIEKTLAVEPAGLAASLGHLMLRVVTGLMIFYVHGWHKLEGLIAYLQHGTPWKLAEEVAGMHFPAPFASAVAATIVQFICSLFVTAGLFTRIKAALLSGLLGVAILQNLLAGRDPPAGDSLCFNNGGHDSPRRGQVFIRWDECSPGHTHSQPTMQIT
jgi:uncharacterized membrane protein YphA (DoxX/SURF4 family)